MRDIAVVLIVGVITLMALKRPWIGVMLWTWLSLMSPHRLAWSFAYDAPLAAIAAGVTLIGLLTTKERQSPFQGAPVVFFTAFVYGSRCPGFLALVPPGTTRTGARS